MEKRISCRMLLVVGLMLVSVMGSAVAGTTSSYTAEFPSADSTFVASTSSQFRYFWSVQRGDCIYETFAGTGLDSVDGLALHFVVDFNCLTSVPVNWDVRVNETTVGTWSWAPADDTGNVDLDYSFAPITGSGTYVVGMYVTNEVPDGYGSIGLANSGSMTLSCSGGQPAVPEWGSIFLAITGLGSVSGAMRLRKRA